MSASKPRIELPIPVSYKPMEAKLVEEVPSGDEWLFEPKWDGFRCLAFRDGDSVDLRSKSGKPLGRYFPDVVEMLLGLDADKFVLDGEIVIPSGASLSFDDLLLRIHPAASRVQKLAAASPALFIAFDLLVEAGTDLTGESLGDRRDRLERFAKTALAKQAGVRLSPSTNDADEARKWLADNRAGLDGVMAKKTELTYQSGNRLGMFKVKTLRTADCVVGGFRWSKDGDTIGSMLLGLYNREGELDHIGFCSALTAARRREAASKLEPLAGGDGFTGSEPKGESRWRSEEAADWIRVEPTIVVEVRYDHFSGGRFRHGTRFMRWRPDKAPEACTVDQLVLEGKTALSID